MDRRLTLLFICFVSVGTLLPKFVYSKAARDLSSETTGATKPGILYAQWSGKGLDVEGANFGDGAMVLVDGQKLKTINSEKFPDSFLFAKNAKKKVARNQAITLQVQNPDGEVSDPFPFFSGFLLTMNDSGEVLRLSVGDRFLLFLPPHGEPPTLGWSVSLGGNDQSSLTVLTRSMDNLPIPRAQGFFEAVHPGIVTISSEASPLCPPLPPEQCGTRGVNFGRFDLIVFVE